MHPPDKISKQFFQVWGRVVVGRKIKHIKLDINH